MSIATTASVVRQRCIAALPEQIRAFFPASNPSSLRTIEVSQQIMASFVRVNEQLTRCIFSLLQMLPHAPGALIRSAAAAPPDWPIITVLA
jgi:hypothetical protein